MQQDVLVSIIVATYNHEKYIKKAIRSILMQEMPFTYEVLIGEDGSSDKTSIVLKKLECELPQNYKIFYRKPNMGAGANFNDLYSKAKGKYLIVLEGDDYWIYPKKLKTQVEFLESHPDYIAVAHNTEVVDKNGNLRTDYIYPECKKDNYTLLDYQNGILMGQTTTIMYRNYWKDKLFSDINVSVNYPGDQKKNFLLACHGKIKCFQEKWSAYRYVTDEGTSFSALVKYDHDIARRELIFFRELQQYAKEIGNEEAFAVSEARFLMAALSYCIKRKGPDYGLKRWVYDFWKSTYKINFINLFCHKVILNKLKF